MVLAKAKFLDFLKDNKNKRFAIAPHARADIDAISCAFALHSVFPNSIVAIPDELNESATALANELKIKYQIIKNLDKKKFDGMIVVDTSAYTLLKEAKDWNIKLIVDHHRAEGRDMQSEDAVIEEQSPSCAELVANILPEIKNKEIAIALACAIISDTARFKSGRKETFETLARLLSIANATYQDVLKFGEPELASDVKIAVLKAFQRANYQIIGSYIVATSEVSGNEGDASAALSEVADVAFVANFKEEENQCRISARARKHVNVALHEVMKAVAMQLGGNGGGHPKAAGVAVPKGRPKDVLKACVDVFALKVK